MPGFTSVLCCFGCDSFGIYFEVRCYDAFVLSVQNRFVCLGSLWYHMI